MATKRTLLSQIADVSVLCPDMRLGQMLATLGSLSEDMYGRGLWDVEDRELVAVVERFRKDLSRREPKQPFRKKLRRILEERFPPPDKVELREEDRFTGIVTSKQFRRKDHMKRHEMIHEFLKTRLTDKEMSRVLMIIAMTPEEERVQRAIHDWSERFGC